MKGITRKEFDEFTDNMWQRLKMGEKKYGHKFKSADIKNEIKYEAVDLANYSFMLFLKAVKFSRKINENISV